jgi:tellurite resistance-related uncharacterized protein
MLRIPQSCIHTRSTPFWNKETAPAGSFNAISIKVPAQAFTLAFLLCKAWCAI